MAVLFLSAGVFFIGGTFSIGAGLILSVVVVLICLCLAELASMFPIAGGMYSLVHKVLPGPFSWITMSTTSFRGSSSRPASRSAWSGSSRTCSPASVCRTP